MAASYFCSYSFVKNVNDVRLFAVSIYGTTEFFSSSDCEMIGPNAEIIIVNFEEPTLIDEKPRLTYTLAERISKQVF